MTEIKKSNSIAMIRTSGLTYEYRYILNDDSNISTDNTRKTAEQEFTVTIALKGVDLTIQKGEFVAVLGHNGSGKSTLAKQFNALLTPTHGAVWVIGLDTKMEENVWRIRQHAGMVFQNPDNQIIASVVEEDIAFGPENMGVPPDEIRQRVDEALRAVGMSEYADYSPHYLSGGQKQRIGIAGVLAMRPDCIILDEPTAMLDPLGRNDVIATITRLNREEGITVILITHYMDEAVKADRVIVMDDGRTVMDGAPKEVFKNVEELRTIGLDVPQVAEIAHRLRKQGFPLDGSILTIEEMAEALLKVKKKED